MTIPAYLPYFVFAGSAATLFAILYGLHRSLVEAKWHAADRARTFRISSAILLGWLAVTVGLGAFGVYHVDSTEVSNHPVCHPAADCDRRAADLAVRT